jgi:Predicted esterase of the alpha-beta hydrolase superfamily
MKKIGLVLEGGALRGIFTAGVLDLLIERNIYFPYIVGASAGACNMLGYISKQKGYTRDSMIQKEASQRFFGLNQLLQTGRILNLDKIFFEFPYKENPFDFETYFNSGIESEMVVTNCLTGKAEYFQEKSQEKKLSAIGKASSSMPLFTSMVEIDGQPYLDGGLSDSIPIQRALEKGYEKNVVILTRNRGSTVTLTTYQKKIYQSFYNKYPELLNTILSRPGMYQKKLEYIQALEEAGKIFVIQPDKPTVKRLETDYDKLLLHYQHGYELMNTKFESLMQFIS